MKKVWKGNFQKLISSEVLSLFNLGLELHLFMNLFTKIIPIEDYMAYFNYFFNLLA